MMNITISLLFLAAPALLGASAAAAAGGPARAVPAPLADHPGNVFLAGEAVTVPVAAKDGAPWECIDYDGKKAAEGKAAAGRAEAGELPVGWYDVRWAAYDGGPAGHASAAVLERLKAPTPAASPIGCDVAMAWFYPEAKMPAVANLCALAGINWVRDRLNWAELEPQRGKFAPPGTKYDASARIQAAAGLRVLQVNHISPAWANPQTKRFPPDLADAYRFYREMAKRWAGRVEAFEPWNEADIDVFGGHTGAEMASMQKASYLGLKAGNPAAVGCLNVFAVPQKAILRDLDANESWPYFDTFNLHHYAPTDQYGGIYAEFRASSAGRPMWVTEFAVPVQWSGDEKLKEPSDADLRVQAERAAQVFAASLHEGPAVSFYFLLPHYVEGKTQFGLIRPDLTPRPAFAALAAVGRFLADARPLGRLKNVPQAARAFLFRAMPDGREREVLVAWTKAGQADCTLPAAPEGLFDHLGRSVAGGAALRLSTAPLFAVLPAGTSAKIVLEAPPAPVPKPAGEASPVILQAAWPKERQALDRSAYRLSAEKAETVPVYVYNFSDAAVEGRLAADRPQGWHIQLPAQVKVGPGQKVELALVVNCRAATSPPVQRVRIAGDFGKAGKCVLSLNIMPEAVKKQ
jgi:hypothetical protein